MFGSYKISRRPGLGHRTGLDIASTMNAPDFSHALSRFLAATDITQSPSSLQDLTYPVYKKFSRVLPSLRGHALDTHFDTISAIPRGTEHSADRCSTLLYVEDADCAETIGVKGMSYL